MVHGFGIQKKNTPTTYTGLQDPLPDVDYIRKNKKKQVRKLKMMWAGRGPHWYYEWEDEE